MASQRQENLRLAKRNNKETLMLAKERKKEDSKKKLKEIAGSKYHRGKSCQRLTLIQMTNLNKGESEKTEKALLRASEHAGSSPSSQGNPARERKCPETSERITRS